MIRGILQKQFDRLDYAMNKKRIIIGDTPYRWCTIPAPKGYSQSQTHPAIQYIPHAWNGYTHWLATTPYPNADVRFENPCIYKANSETAAPPSVFHPIRQNPIACWPGGSGYNSDPELFFANNQLYCIVRENENTRFLREIKLYVSADGESWNYLKTIYTSNDEERQLLSPTYEFRENAHYLYFLNGDAGIGRHGSCSGIEIIRSSDFEKSDFRFYAKGNFVNKKENRIEPWHFDLFRCDGLLYMLFCGRDKRKKTWRNPMETYLAVSTDDINFHIFERPVIRHLKSYRPSVYLDEKQVLHIYFSVIGSFMPDGSDRNIGVTSIPFQKLLSYLSKNENPVYKYF